MGVTDKLMKVQSELKSPKNQFNSFGKYKYRSCEDILEDLKPVLVKHKASLYISDELVLVGDRYYVKATATFIDTETNEQVQNTAFARESDDKKGMDASQVTGATSSYARKYALNGLLLIDDTKDADTDEYQNQQNKGTKKAKAEQKAEPSLVNENTQNYPSRDELLEIAKKHYPDGSDSLNALLSMWKIDALDKASNPQLMIIYNKYNKV